MTGFLENSIESSLTTMHKTVIVINLFFVSYSLWIVGAGQSIGNLLMVSLFFLFGVYLSTYTLMNKNRMIYFWDVLCLLSSFAALNIVTYTTGGYYSTYHFLYLMPVVIFIFDGKISLAKAFVNLTTAAMALCWLVQMHMVKHSFVIDDNFLYLLGVIVLMRFEFRILSRLTETVEQKILQMEGDVKIDHQTCLWRYSEFEKLLKGKVLQWKTEGIPFQLVIIDLGNLQYHNSKYGFKTGDKIISGMAEALRNALPSGDEAFRYSGDQFAVFSGADKGTVEEFINGLQADARRVAAKLDIDRLNLLVGCANCPEDACAEDDILEHAMNRLEDAKALVKREKIERQKRAEKMALVGHLAAGLAHELRNPLTSVKGFCQLAKEATGEPTVKGYLDFANDDVERLIKLINDFLLLTKPSAPHLQPLDIIDLLQEIIDFLESQARLYEVSVVMQIPSCFPLVMGDKEQLRQAIVNVMVNAFEAISENGQLNVRLYSLADRIAIAFEDNGMGITKQDISHILNPFFTTKEEGTGLGLAITQHIVASHGGDIVVRSEEGMGTVVTLYLPVLEEKVKHMIG